MNREPLSTSTSFISLRQPPLRHPFGKRLGLIAGHLIGKREKPRLVSLASHVIGSRGTADTTASSRICSTRLASAHAGTRPDAAHIEKRQPVHAGSDQRTCPIPARCRTRSPCAAAASIASLAAPWRARNSPRPRSRQRIRLGGNEIGHRPVHHPHRARAILVPRDPRRAAATSPSPTRATSEVTTTSRR